MTERTQTHLKPQTSKQLTYDWVGLWEMKTKAQLGAGADCGKNKTFK